MGPLPLCQPVGLSLLLLLGPVLWLSAASQRSHVHRRGLIELAGTVECAGTRSSMAYVNYVPAQEDGQESIPAFTHLLVCLATIHRCCHHHDCCYNRAEDAGCSPKLERYSWQCVNHSIQCGPAEDKCQELMCKCDQEVASCLAQTEYNLKYLFYPSFLCGTDSPKCD
uniref:Phospholipase A2 n=1 Tax=Camelus bactrianus TaxID=9837 RepID=A0A9W3HMH2_CAMBA|nr:group 10 secretory phospholipase A2-like [Camelus bactrianus]